MSERAGIKDHGGYGLTAVAADFDGDGWPDIYVACDSVPSLLFRNNHDGTFTERGLESGIALNEDGKEQAGMGLGIGDFDTDGHLDIFKTHFSADTNILYRNNGKGTFRDVTTRAGLGVETRFVGWGAAIQDFDNDGLARYLLHHRNGLAGSGGVTARCPLQNAQCRVPQSGRRTIRRTAGRSRAGDEGTPFQPRRGVRRFR